MASPLSNAELQKKVKEIETVLDKLILAVNNTASTTTLNASILAQQTELDSLRAQLSAVQNSLISLQTIVVG